MGIYGIMWMEEAARYARGEPVENLIGLLLGRMLEMDEQGKPPGMIAGYLRGLMFEFRGLVVRPTFSADEVFNLVQRMREVKAEMEQEAGEHFPGNTPGSGGD